jgi:hypothetical protein
MAVIYITPSESHFPILKKLMKGFLGFDDEGQGGYPYSFNGEVNNNYQNGLLGFSGPAVQSGVPFAPPPYYPAGGGVPPYYPGLGGFSNQYANGGQSQQSQSHHESHHEVHDEVHDERFSSNQESAGGFNNFNNFASPYPQQLQYPNYRPLLPTYAAYTENNYIGPLGRRFARNSNDEFADLTAGKTIADFQAHQQSAAAKAIKSVSDEILRVSLPLETPAVKPNQSLMRVAKSVNGYIHFPPFN